MKGKDYLRIIVTIIAIGIVCLSGIFKLLQGQDIIAKMQHVNVSQYIIPLGLMELGFACLFAFKKTLRIGFILLSCYFAGALSVELSYGIPMNALLPISLIWVAAFLRDKNLFLGSASL